MAAVGDDCYFFCTSTCAKGAACPFRHVESAKTNKVICQHWQTTGCYRSMCKFRHSDFHIQVNYSEIPCYWESQPVGCSKANCAYKHNKPRSNLGTTDAQAKPNSPEQKDGTNTDGADKETFDQFVMPTVKPVIIDPESEASNSSPVKKPPPKDITEETTEQANEQRKEAQDKDTKKGNVETAGKIEGKKKVVKVVGKKKKAGVLTQKNGKLATAAKGAKKGKKAANGSPATKGPVKRKKINSDNAKPVVPAKKLVKDRLGTQSKKEEPLNKEEESSSSDSDDSIENVKVLSMEEIFRQKALESMMKKRAAEGKPMLPEYGTSRNKPAVVRSQPSRPAVVDNRPRRSAIADSRPKKQVADSRPKKQVADSRPKKQVADSRPKKQLVVRKKPLMPPPPPQESSESEEEEEQQHDIEAKGGREAEEEDSSSSESESSCSDSSESEVRRVVINLDAEKAAREKAKASLVKRRHMETATTSKTTKKRKVIRQEPMSFSRSVTSTAQRGLSVKERLGKPNSTTVIASSVTRREVVREVSSEEEEDGSDESSNKEDSESFPDVKVKSLDEIRREKSNRLGHSPIKDRLGPSKTSEEDDEEEEKSGRQILITEDKASPSKARKRPWSAGVQSKTKPVPKETRVEEDQRTVSATSPVNEEPVQGLDIDEPESPFESLRRRALMKKTQQVETNVSSETKDGERSDGGEGATEEEEVSGKRKKHKHKHKHKKHKRSKSERQIYIPPAKKSVITQVLEQVKKVPSLLSRQEDIPEYVEDISINKSTSPSTSLTVQARPKPRAGAMWAAGLSVSSKGLGGRPHLKVNADKHDDDVQVISVPPQKPFMNSKSSNSILSSSTKDSDPSVPVVKTFSQIMAEKRQKRQQAQESGISVVSSASSSSSSPSRMSSQSDNSRQRGAIKPVKFDLDGEFKVNQPTKVKPTATSVLNLGGSSQSPPSSSLFSSRTTTIKPRISPINHESISSSPSSSKSSSTVSLSDIRPTYKTVRAKKLFNKKAVTKTQAEDFTTSLSTSGSPTHDISPSYSSTLMDKTASPSPSSSHHHHPSEDAAIALKSPTTDEKKQRRASTASESHPKRSISLEDEFAIFDGGEDIEDISDIVDKDVEPIDDLLQDIDDLLS